jgi:hypothetical protein
LFSDATSDAKAKDRRKVTASENKTTLYGTLAAAVFNLTPVKGEKLSDDEEALKADCKGNLTICTTKCDACKGKPKLIYARI